MATTDDRLEAQARTETPAERRRRLISAEYARAEALDALSLVVSAAEILGCAWRRVEVTRESDPDGASQLSRSHKAVNGVGLAAERAVADPSGKAPGPPSEADRVRPWPQVLAEFNDATTRFRTAVRAAVAPVVNPAGAPVRAAAAVMGAEWVDRVVEEVDRLARLLPAHDSTIAEHDCPVPDRLRTLAFRPQQKAQTDPLLELVDALRSELPEAQSLANAAVYRGGRWFDDATGGLLTANALRKAAQRGNLSRSRKRDSSKEWLHHVEEVQRRHAQYSHKIRAALDKERGAKEAMAGQVEPKAGQAGR